MEEITLTDMKSGQQGRISAVSGGKMMVRRLDAMGIRPGVIVKKISGQLIRGPVLVKVGTTQAAIGFGMAQRIFLKLLADKE